MTRAPLGVEGKTLEPSVSGAISIKLPDSRYTRYYLTLSLALLRSTSLRSGTTGVWTCVSYWRQKDRAGPHASPANNKSVSTRYP